MMARRAGVAVVVAVALVVGYMQLTASAGGLTVTPNAGLPSGADVEVSGAGFAAGQSGDVLECVDAAGTVGACVPIGSFETDGDGNFGPVPVTVEQSYLASDGTPVDCLPDDNCVVATSLDLSVVAPISFSAFGPTTSTSTTTTTTEPPTTTTTEPTTTTSMAPPTTSVPSSPLCSLAQGLASVPLLGLVFSVLEPVVCGS
ncbi:MAG: Neocarzinostatin family [Actinomycetota bacterium]|nr:Neocarzinostatin family [Actinomycetota bacterium]